jgi:hypothetical protein
VRPAQSINQFKDGETKAGLFHDDIFHVGIFPRGTGDDIARGMDTVVPAVIDVKARDVSSFP